MRTSACFTLSIAAALFAGCDGSPPAIGAPGAMPSTSAIATHEQVGAVGGIIAADLPNRGI